MMKGRRLRGVRPSYIELTAAPFSATHSRRGMSGVRLTLPLT